MIRILAARHVLPVSSDPVADGAVAISGATIEAVGPLAQLAELFPDARVTDFGEAAILPGFVNCHSHLEITSMRGALDSVEHDFTAWLLRLTEIRSGLSDEYISETARLGAIEGARAGVTCFGDIGRFGAVGLNALKSAGVRGVLFQETEFSVEDATATPDFERLIGKFETLKNDETDLVKVGLSPHSPYTVGPKLLGMIADYSIANGVSISIHAAESAAENELLTCGTGHFTRVYAKYRVSWTSPLCTPIEYLDRLGVLRARPLLAHCVRASDADLDLIAASGASIAHCPKSNAKFGHGSAPFELMLERGIAVGFGSDSVASNNLCDLIEESRFALLNARNRPGSERFIAAKEAIETATLGGAAALGMDKEIGSLEAGKQADIAVVSLAEPAQQPVNDVHTAIVFASNARDVVMTMVAGREIFSR
jgi:cytosine/adenosine deaminase-related metal-dependent hydrolase